MGKYKYNIYLAFDTNEDNEIVNYTTDVYYTEQHFDRLSITNGGIYLECHRARDRASSKILTDFKSTFNKLVTKSLCFFIATNGFIPAIKLVKIEKFEFENKIEEHIYPHEKLLQPFSNRLSDDLLFDENKLSALFFSNYKSESLMMSLSLWLKGTTSELAGDGFDRLWTSFNSLYTYITRRNNEFDKLKDMRSFILSNRDIFTKSADFFNDINSRDIRKLRWRELILNDYETESKTDALKDFIFRYRDYRINEVFLEILPYRKAFLINTGDYEEVERQIKIRIAEGLKDNHEVLCLYIIKYSYFIRNKYFHGEKLDPTIYLIKTLEISELLLINRIFAIFLKELITENSNY